MLQLTHDHADECVLREPIPIRSHAGSHTEKREARNRTCSSPSKSDEPCGYFPSPAGDTYRTLLPMLDMRLSARVLVGLSAFLAVCVGVTTNIAAGELPATWHPYLWITWPISLILAMGLVALEVRRASSERRSAGEVAAPDSPIPRVRLMERVERAWVIDGLQRSLYQQARLELGLIQTVDAPHPWELMSARPRGESERVPPGTPIKFVFKQLDQAMLILGSPGSGKTTTMLELLRDLLAEARADSSVPIPVFLPLASWALTREPLDSWIMREIGERYQVSASHVKAWLDREQLSPLLDGLDEVADDYRQMCVDAINSFRGKHGAAPIVVGCRTLDYNRFQAKLQLYGTLRIEDLSRDHIERFLDRSDGLFDGVRIALSRYPILWDLAHAPLVLSIMVLAFRDFDSTSELDRITRRGWLDLLFVTYVRTMLNHRTSARQRRDSTVRTLAFLADQLQWRNQTIFTLDLLPELSLPARRWVTPLKWGNSLLQFSAGALVVGPIAGFLYGWRGAAIGVIAGCFCVYLAKEPESSTGIVDNARPKPWIQYRNRTPEGACLLTLIVGATAGILLGLPYGISSAVTYTFAAMLAGVVALIVMGSFQRSETIVPQRFLGSDFPSPRLQAALHRSYVIAPIAGVSAGFLSGGLIAWLDAVDAGLRFGITTGTCTGFLVLGALGGAALISQVSIRIALKWADLVPFPSKSFFDYSVDCLFLQRAGNNYLFVHRTLQEFFAALCPSKKIETPDSVFFRPGEPNSERVDAIVFGEQ
jgi:Cdc6-like AAA superfamily ATPase